MELNDVDKKVNLVPCSDYNSTELQTLYHTDEVRTTVYYFYELPGTSILVLHWLKGTECKSKSDVQVVSVNFSTLCMCSK